MSWCPGRERDRAQADRTDLDAGVPDGVSIEVLAERLEGLRADVAELAAEQQRNRTRLHNLEGFAAAAIDTQRQNRRSEDRQYKRLETRLQVLTIVIAIAAVVVPLLVALVNRK
jgi:hypothetical protein